MESKHTPEAKLWSVSESPIHKTAESPILRPVWFKNVKSVPGIGGTIIAKVMGVSKKEVEANAALIASAPDLAAQVAALKEEVEQLKKHNENKTIAALTAQRDELLHALLPPLKVIRHVLGIETQNENAHRIAITDFDHHLRRKK